MKEQQMQFGSSEEFQKLSKFEGEAIATRDEEDAVKLQAGIEISIARGVLTKLDPSPEYISIDVLGKTPDQVCDIILAHMGDAAKTGCVLILCGLSGTGKGTTVARLQQCLSNATAWSNGNVFRSLTLLASTWCEQQGEDVFVPSKALTPENVAHFMGMLKFDKFDDSEWDIEINGLGIQARVSKIKNTLLKEPKVSKNIPTVAEQTQGEVVKFASEATKKMAQDGFTVLLEGREATVNYIDSPFRYTLTMSDLNCPRSTPRGAAHCGCCSCSFSFSPSQIAF